MVKKTIQVEINNHSAGSKGAIVVISNLKYPTDFLTMKFKEIEEIVKSKEESLKVGLLMNTGPFELTKQTFELIYKGFNMCFGSGFAPIKASMNVVDDSFLDDISYEGYQYGDKVKKNISNMKFMK